MARTDMVMTGISKDEARSLLRTLRPLAGWRIPTGKTTVAVDNVVQALEAMVADAGSLDSLLKPFADGDAGDVDSTGIMRDDTVDAFALVDERLDRERETENLDDLYAVLSPNEKFIVTALFGVGTRERTTKEIAAELGTSRQAVEQQRDRALARMRGDLAPHKESPVALAS